jgi:hypothetical protein
MSRPVQGLPDRPDQPHDPAQLDDQPADGQAIAYEDDPGRRHRDGRRCGVAKVDVSTDGGRTVVQDDARSRRGQVQLPALGYAGAAADAGQPRLMVRCWNTRFAQPMKPIWNPGGFMRGNIETTTIIAA